MKTLITINNQNEITTFSTKKVGRFAINTALKKAFGRSAFVFGDQKHGEGTIVSVAGYYKDKKTSGNPILANNVIIYSKIV
jgi:hypothetical protein